ncbi:MAG: hypothetical protein ACTSRU_18545 [Candidatus Hodarchaeales archaeon]
MIARIWHGRTAKEKTATYADFKNPRRFLITNLLKETWVLPF